MSPYAELVVKRVTAEIDNLKYFTAVAGWDSYDASPVESRELDRAKDCVRAAAREIESVFRAPLVGPTAAPGVTLAWRGPWGEVDAHFAPSGSTYMILGPDRTLVTKGPIADPKTFAVDVLKPYLQLQK